MKVFLLDLWLDLRAKRLTPIAILLLAGIIVVPVVLAKGEKNVPPPPVQTTAAAAPAAAVVASSEQADQVDSKLQTFSARDPFEPTGHAAVAGSTTTSGTGTGTSTGTSTSGSTTTTGTSGGGGATNGNAPTTTPGGTGTTGNGNTGSTTTQPKVTLFTYTADLRFGEAGGVKAYKGVKRLELIPDDKNPKLVFLGVTTTGKTAVFLVDSNIGVDTPGGRCRPSADECTFLYLRPESGHDQAVLTDADGTVYHMRLLGINRVTVSSSTGSTNNTNSGSGSNGNGSTKRSPAFTGSTDKSQTTDGASSTGTPPGEPDKGSSFQQFFADSGQ
jgi:hypothetical protein